MFEQISLNDVLLFQFCKWTFMKGTIFYLNTCTA